MGEGRGGRVLRVWGWRGGRNRSVHSEWKPRAPGTDGIILPMPMPQKEMGDLFPGEACLGCRGHR